MTMIISLFLGLLLAFGAFVLFTMGKNKKSTLYYGAGIFTAAIALYFLIPPLISITFYALILAAIAVVVFFVLKLSKKRV